MPIISDKLKKATKKAEKEEQKRKEEEERRLKEEQEKKELEEKEAKEREEQEKKQKKMEKLQKRKERHDKHKKDKDEMEKKTIMRKEMALIKRSMAAKPIKDEDMLQRQGYQILRTEVKSGHYSRVYRAKQDKNESVICKVVILEKVPNDYRQNLLESAVKIQRYIGSNAEESANKDTPKKDTKESKESKESKEAKEGDATQTGADASAAPTNGAKHANLVKVYDIFATDKKVYIFQEECLPQSVFEKFRKSETVDENEVKKIVKDLAQCIKYLHSVGVAHCNISISHVIQDKQNQLKLVGLNKSCFYWDSDLEAIIPKKKLSKKDFEKNNHLPPEVFKSETWDPSLADVWSFGVVLCQLLAKENPFKMSSQSFEEQWKAFAESKQFSDEAKQLLDRIFVEDLQKRPNMWDLISDSFFKSVS
ncbi:DNA ligase 1-like [Oppia nitens]|uniref:DNA ligase 1-like n=1 Tax=Oppia nitens TaxID=1686743 RepID=UPI0023D9B8CB|nr:DNA ligase 1-like [Oppia nitens]